LVDDTITIDLSLLLSRSGFGCEKEDFGPQGPDAEIQILTELHAQERELCLFQHAGLCRGSLKTEREKLDKLRLAFFSSETPVVDLE